MAASPPSRAEPTEPDTLDPSDHAGSAEPVEPPRRPFPRQLVLVLLACVLLAGVVVIAAVRGRGGMPQGPVKPKFTVAQLKPRAGASVPAEAAPVPAQLADWSERIADRTDIPARTLLAYATAEQKMRRTDPGCHLSWATLAGLGRVESSHGEYGGAEVLDDGTLSRPIIGVPLDGSKGVQAIKDTDGGVLDGDPVWDRAVGSMQFVPTTWQRWAVRASGDGRAPDPQNVDDAALASARYLCGAGGDLATPPGWWRAVLTYNQSVTYGRNVFSGADAYARVHP